MQTVFRLCLVFFLASISLATAHGQASQDIPLAVEYEFREKVQQRLQSFGNDILGDSIDLKTGALSFNHTDISLPGNFDLEVAIRRKRVSEYAFESSNISHFGDWSLEVPHITTIVEGGDGPGNGIPSTNAACGINVWPPVIVLPIGPTGPIDPFIPSDPDSPYILEGYEYSNGLNMNIPGQGSKQLLTNPKGISWPSGSQYVTNDNWQVKCISGNTGYLATAPNGDVYRFDKFKSKNARPMDAGDATLRRFHAVYQASSVTDVNGNSVNYSYDSAGLLQQISASDGRSISLTYDYNPSRIYFSRKQISSVTANNRTWSYSYSGTHTLGSVTRPDGKSWNFSINGATSPMTDPHDCPSTYSYITTANVTHPNGMSGTFQFKPYRHRKYGSSTRMKRCANQTGHNVNYYLSRSVISKTLSGTGYPAQTWSFSYSNATTTNPWGQSVNPLGHRTRTTYKGVYGLLADLEEKTETFATASSSSPMRRVQYSYISENAVGDSHLENLNRDTITRPRHRTKTVTTQEGDTYTSEASYNTSQGTSGYSYGNPTQTKSYSNVSTAPRIINTTYEHKIAKWILGLPKTMTRGDGVQMSSYIYDPYGRKTSQTRYEQPYATFGYHTNAAYKGALFWMKDAIDRQTVFYDWKRGVPQRIKRPDTISEYQYVDNNGWLTSTKDGKQQTTSYTHDNMGRLTLINPTGTYWLNTYIAYNFSGGGAVQTITKGQSKTTVTYDGMFRPILERTQALDTGWSSYTNTKYDALGQVKFKSQPSINQYETKGVDYTYDGLGRIYSERENVAPYAITSHRYYSSHRHRIHDPSGAWTDHYSYGYGGPGNTDYRAIYKYANGAYQQHNYIYKNTYGQMYRLRQWGNANGYSGDKSQYFYYDGQQRLRRHYVPEHGATKYDYNPAGEMIAYAKGQGNSGFGVANITAKVSQTYHVNGWADDTLYNDPATDNIYRIHDANGNVLSVNRGGVNWSYVYNDIDLITSENLSVDGYNFGLSYLYNPSGDMKRKTFPSTRYTRFYPDGLGRATRANYGSANYANNITYHASGTVSAFNYLNGFNYSQTLNNRLMPQRVLSTKGGAKAVDMTYSYDPRGKVTSIIDGAVSGNNRTYGYDGLGRLTSASGPWGTGSFKYDPLDNLRQKKLGSRTVNLSYDSRNRLFQSADTGSSGTRTVAYDAQGNVTTLGNLGFLYDYSDQPVVVSGTANGIGAANGAYTYDGNLKRVKSVVNGKTIYNVYSASGELSYKYEPSGDKKTDYLRAAGMTIGRRDRVGTVTYTHRDHLGSAVTTSTASGVIGCRDKYTPFGETMSTTSCSEDDDAFTGHIKDSATGLNYMQARYYDPVIGRFLSIDPVTFMDTGNPGMFNRYAYTFNDPINLTDPDGRNPLILPSAGRYAAKKAKNKLLVPAGAAVTGAVFGGAAGSQEVVQDFIDIGIATLTGANNEQATPLPEGLVGEEQGNSQRGEGKYNSGPLSPDNGGTGNAEEDFGTLTGGDSSPAGSDRPNAPEGTLVGGNGIQLRPGTETKGPRIDIPGNSETGKRPETLHYPDP